MNNEEQLFKSVWNLKQVLKTKYKLLLLTPEMNLQMNNDLARFLLDVQNILVKKLSQNKVILDADKVRELLDIEPDICDNCHDKLKDAIAHIKERFYLVQEKDNAKT